jgi:hypothetical protein
VSGARNNPDGMRFTTQRAEEMQRRRVRPAELRRRTKRALRQRGADQCSDRYKPAHLPVARDVVAAYVEGNRQRAAWIELFAPTPRIGSLPETRPGYEEGGRRR